MQFSYGQALFLILLVALASGAGLLWTHSRYRENRPDLVLVTHARLHADVYRAKLPDSAVMRSPNIASPAGGS